MTVPATLKPAAMATPLLQMYPLDPSAPANTRRAVLSPVMAGPGTGNTWLGNRDGMGKSVVRGNVVFCKVVAVTFVNRTSPDRLRPITITITLDRTVHALDIQLTDESDPFFLQYLHLVEQDFPTLKSDQCLLVDFGQFPAKLVELLEMCVKEVDKEQPRFIAQLHLKDLGVSGAGAGGAQLHIIETNTFRNISHLTLTLTNASDTVLKSHLAALVKDLKSQNHSLEDELVRTQSKLTTCQQTLDELKEDSRENDARRKEELIDIREKASLECERVRENGRKETEDVRREMQAWSREVERKYELKIKAMTTQHQNLTTSQSHLLTRTHTLETTLTTTRSDLDQLRSAHQSTLATLHSRESEVADLNGRLNSMSDLLENERMQRKSKDERIAHLEGKCERLESEVRELYEGKCEVEEVVSGERQRLVGLEDALRKCREEIYKGNDIILRLQAQLRTAKAGLRHKTHSLNSHVTLLDERSATISSMEEKLEKLEKEVKEAKEGWETEKKAVEDEKARRVKCEKSVEENQKVIEWLHEQLNNAPKPILQRTSATRHRFRPTLDPTSALSRHARDIAKSTSSITTAGMATIESRTGGGIATDTAASNEPNVPSSRGVGLGRKSAYFPT